MDANFRWFEGEKAQYRFVPYDWAFLFFCIGLLVCLGALRVSASVLIAAAMGLPSLYIGYY